VFETGFYIKPYKSKRHVFGVNAVIIASETIIDTYRNRYVAARPVFNINVSYNLKLNK